MAKSLKAERARHERNIDKHKKKAGDLLLCASDAKNSPLLIEGFKKKAEEMLSAVDSETALKAEIEVKINALNDLKKRSDLTLTADDLFPTLEQTREVLHTLIDHIEINDKSGDIEIFFRD